MAPPIYVKGGVWTNIEDQILKAAVSKYGLTQWARVASLLPKKTAKQAKARWNEYLNPTINRRDWSKEEDEKLLGLAKLLPHQWRSIAPIIGRTATQCVERYQQLLEAAIKNDDDNEDDLKLTGPGIETLPALGNAFESLPSRPDLEEMDEDEQEMLSEAKARLANTQGKKAKRKDRERMLNESKRISLLQKRRELKAAGVNVSLELRNKRKRTEFDYNADIPHEHAPPPVLFDVVEEDQTNLRDKNAFQKQVNAKGISMKEVDDKHKKKNDAKAKQDAKRLRAEILASAEIFSELAESQSKRRKLELPEPGQHDDDDIEERILAKSRELLPDSETYVKSGLKKETLPIQKITHPDRVSRKEMVSAIHKALAVLPPPKNKIEIVLPSLDQSEEQILSLVPQDDRAENLKILQQVEAEKEKLRRSQVVQRGIEIPNPANFGPIPNGLDQLHKAIATEFQALVRSDFTEFENPAAGYKVLDTLDEDLFGEVTKLVGTEMKKMKRAPREPEAFSLPESLGVVEQIHEELDRLDDSASVSEQAVLEDFARYEQEFRSKYEALQERYADLADLTIEEALAQRAAQNEEVAIGIRSSRLHEMVELILEAESRCK